MPPNFASFLPVLSIILTLLLSFVVTVGAVFAFRGNANRSTNEIQKSTIDALKAQNEAQEKQIKVMERKIDRLEATLSTLQLTLQKRRGLIVEINDDLVTLIDQRTGQEHTVRIHTHEENEKEAP